MIFCYKLGLASRKCDGDPAEWQEPDVNNCSTVEITRIMEEAERLDEILKNASNSENADLTIMVEPEVVEAITEELASLTDIEETILPNDLANTLGTIDSLIRYKLCVYNIVIQCVSKGLLSPVCRGYL